MLLTRALRLKCLTCGQGRLFRTWLHMEQECLACHTSFTREPGFYLGSIYFNYGLTALIVAIAYPALLFNRLVSDFWLQVGCFTFAVLFPMWFFRYARALWLGFDLFADPPENVQQEEASQEDSPK
jgi:uncharacterized protein (DUF983 family)